jgi:hypothetical protein
VHGEDRHGVYDNARWQVVSLPAPPAGQELDIRNGGIGPWRLWYLGFRFTTSAVVNVRVPRFTLDQDTLTYLRFPHASTFAANTTGRFQGMSGDIGAPTVDGVTFLPWPDFGPILRPGDHLRSVTALIDAADFYDQIVAYIEEIPWQDSARTQQETVAEIVQYGL